MFVIYKHLHHAHAYIDLLASSFTICLANEDAGNWHKHAHDAVTYILQTWHFSSVITRNDIVLSDGWSSRIVAACKATHCLPVYH